MSDFKYMQVDYKNKAGGLGCPLFIRNILPAFYICPQISVVVFNLFME